MMIVRFLGCFCVSDAKWERGEIDGISKRYFFCVMKYVTDIVYDLYAMSILRKYITVR